jgi:hypothetical protein
MGQVSARFTAAAFLTLLAPLPFLAAVPPVLDQTASLQEAIDALPPNGMLDCAGASYQVTTLQLKSDMTIRNCNFETIPGSVDMAAPVTIDGRNQRLSNISIQNVAVTGNRHGQTNIGYSGQEDGGRHCFRLLGHLTQIVIEGSSGSYCAGDGLALISYGAGTSDSADGLPFQHITIRNSTFAFNRRQGASGDGLNDVTFDNVAFLQNGSTLPGGLEGDQCASYNGQCYGTGFWYEDYETGTAGEGLNNLVFSRCIFRDNFQRSIYFFTRTSSSAAGYAPRGNVNIINSYLDAGTQPLAEDYAIQFQVDDSLVGQMPVFQNITIQNSDLEGSVGFRQAVNVLIVNSSINTNIPYLGYSAYSTEIAFREIIPAAKQIAASLTPNGQPNPVVTYSSTAPISKTATLRPR